MKLNIVLNLNEIAEVRAANKTNKKKIIPIILPKAILLNTLGKVININDAPAFNVSGLPPENVSICNSSF